MANSAIDTNVSALAERLGQDRKADRARMTTIEQSVSDLSVLVNSKESNLQEQIDTNKSAIIAGDSTVLESAKEYSDSKLSIHDASNEAHPYIQGNVGGVSGRVSGIESMLNGVMYEDNIVEGSDYSKIIDTDNVAGSCTVKNYGGRTLVWNQIEQDGGSQAKNNCYITKIGIGTYKFYTDSEGASAHAYLAFSGNRQLKKGHTYLVRGFDTLPAGVTFLDIWSNSVSTKKATVFVCSADSTYQSGLAFSTGAVIPETVIRPQLVDLTLMFGAGNEPATVEEFEALFPADYYEYNAGELLSAGVSEVQSVGKVRVWNNIFTIGARSTSLGIMTDNRDGSYTYSLTEGESTGNRYFNNNADLKNYPENHKLLFMVDKDVSSYFKSYGINVLNNKANNDGITHYASSKRGRICSFSIPFGYFGMSGVASKTAEFTVRPMVFDLTLMFGAGNEPSTVEEFEAMFPGDYYPYDAGTLNVIGSSYIPPAVQNLPGYGWSAGSAKNWVDWEKKIYHREVGRAIYNGSSNVRYLDTTTTHINYIIYISQLFSGGVLLRKDTWDCHFINNRFVRKKNGFNNVWQADWTNAASEAFSISMPTSYETSEQVKEFFASNPLELYYELATPELIDISNILPSNNTLPVESGGTITFKNQHGDNYRLPVPNTLNLPTKIDLKQDTINSVKAFTVKTSLEKAIEAHYALQRTGKLYQVKIPLYDINPTVDCIKTLDNADLVCEPSTDTTEGRDDYADIPLFQWVYCNYVRDDDGTPRPTAIEGMDDFKLTGSVDVGVMQMSFYGKMEQDEEYQILTISDTPHPELGLVPWKNCVDSNGNVLPWNIYSAFQVVTADDGLYRSQPGKYPAYKFSHNGMITEFQKKGKGYWGGTADRNTFQRIFTLIKYGKKSSQAVFTGCTNYTFQHTVSVAETAVKRVIVTTSQGNSYVVGQCVSVGEPYNGTNNDRNYDILHSIADRVLVSAKENVSIDGTEYTAIYLDVPENFTTTSTSIVSSMPCYTGQTMRVNGHHDGSIVSNTNGYYGYRVQGVEYAIGQWLVASDTVGYLNDALTKPSLVYVAPRGLAHSATESVIKSTYTVAGEMTINLNADSTNRVEAPIGDVGLIDFRYGVVYPTVKGTSTANGVGDYFYQGGAALNTCREWLMAGNLGSGPYSGSASMTLWGGLGFASWLYGASD